MAGFASFEFGVAEPAPPYPALFPFWSFFLTVGDCFGFPTQLDSSSSDALCFPFPFRRDSPCTALIPAPDFSVVTNFLLGRSVR